MRLHKSRMFFIAENDKSFIQKSEATQNIKFDGAPRISYVLFGSIQADKKSARVSVKILNYLSGRALWVEKFDQKFSDSISLRDEFARAIVGRLLGAYVHLMAAETNHRMESDVGGLGESDYLLRGWFFWHQCTKEANTKARHLFEEASKLAPFDADAYQALAWCRSQEARFSWCESVEKTLALALELALRAVELDHSNYESHWVLGHVCLIKRDFDCALREFQKAVKLSPDVPQLLADMADLFIYLGRPKEAVHMVEKAMDLNPYYPDWYSRILAQAYTDLGDYGAAMRIYEDIGAVSQNCHLELADIYVRLNQLDDARSEIKKYLAIDPRISLTQFSETFLARHPYQNLKKAEEKLEQTLKNLRSSGIPE